MNRIGNIKFKKLKRISPSQFFSMKNCAYKILLANAFENKPLLPISPNAYLGSVLHKVLEKISKGEIKNDLEFESAFDSEILLTEEKMSENGHDYFVPLQMNVREFGMKKIQLRKHLRVDVIKNLTKSANYIVEKWYESKDNLIGGKIDLIIDTGEVVEIVDFKTGAITEDNFDDTGELYQTIKGDYQDQIRLYAYLFFDSTGKFPGKLTLVDLVKQRYNVDFSFQECQLIFEQAKDLLAQVNDSIDRNELFGNPTETNCKYCLYRPACPFYLNQLNTNPTLNDVSGTIHNIVQHKNGNVTVIISIGNMQLRITGFESIAFQDFSNNLGKQMSLFNLKKESIEFVYTTTKTTMIYEC